MTTSYPFITVHIVHTLPLHNMNRDQSGLPKSQFDGGVQRGRLSSQALKRAARTKFAAATAAPSIRTRDGVGVALEMARDYADSKDLGFDPKKGRSSIKKVVDGLAKGEKEARAAVEGRASEDEGDDDALGDNILFFSRSELETLAISTVEKQQSGNEPARDDCILDARSPSLDVAAFGRLFAAAHDIGTQAAVAVSHAATTHPFHLTADYFSAVDDASAERGDNAGAGHIGMAYYTTGTYYRTFSIDTAQLARSWSRFDSPEATNEVTSLVGALVTALPSGRVTNSNAHTLPALVLVEAQRSRVAYDFDEPLEAVGSGYKKPTIEALHAKRAQALRFDPGNFGPAFVAGETLGLDFAAEEPGTVDGIVRAVADLVFDDTVEGDC